MEIMIVDDSEVVRSVIREALLLYGYTNIIEAEDGEDAMSKVKQSNTSIALYILDVNMPKMDGITLVKEIRKINSSAPIIMLTTETDKVKMLQAKENGATGWIIKPFESKKFIRVIQMLLND